VAAANVLPAVDLPTGKLTTIGKLRQPLAGLISAPCGKWVYGKVVTNKE
jgi:hypothetical protein